MKVREKEESERKKKEIERKKKKVRVKESSSTPFVVFLSPTFFPSQKPFGSLTPVGIRVTKSKEGEGSKRERRRN